MNALTSIPDPCPKNKVFLIKIPVASTLPLVPTSPRITQLVTITLNISDNTPREELKNELSE